MCEPVCLTNCQVLKYKPQHIGVGQNADWKSCHKKICKSYNKYTASPSYQALAQNEKLDALLLSHLVSKLFSSSDIGPMDLLVEDEPTPFSTFSSLLASPATNQATPPICPMGKLDVLMDGVLDELFSRFGNNNFAIHSHLVSIAHGIFPLASRLFNHSCVPNAVARYVLEKSKPPCMEVVALRAIQEGEEVSELPCPDITFQIFKTLKICIPYLDPALYQTRQQIFNITYGFTCTCSSCTFAQSLGPIKYPPHPPQVLDAQDALINSLRKFAFSSDDFSLPGALPKAPLEMIPEDLLQVLHESFLGGLTSIFSTTSHDGPFKVALDVGTTILATYVVLYPPNYPQIGAYHALEGRVCCAQNLSSGMHLLEMAKVAWNALVQSENGVEAGFSREEIERDLRGYLTSSEAALLILGPEGDTWNSPLEEIRTLKRLLVDG